MNKTGHKRKVAEDCKEYERSINETENQAQERSTKVEKREQDAKYRSFYVDNSYVAEEYIESISPGIVSHTTSLAAPQMNETSEKSIAPFCPRKNSIHPCLRRSSFYTETEDFMHPIPAPWEQYTNVRLLHRYVGTSNDFAYFGTPTTFTYLGTKYERTSGRASVDRQLGAYFFLSRTDGPYSGSMIYAKYREKGRMRNRRQVHIGYYNDSVAPTCIYTVQR